MFEAKLTEAITLKKIIDAIKDLVTDVNIDATPQGKYCQFQQTFSDSPTSSPIKKAPNSDHSET